MADGTKRPIDEVRAGDRVKAMDPRDGQVVDREVVRTFRNVTETVVDVTWAPLDRVECMAVGRRGRGERHSVGVARSGGESSEDGEPPSADEAQTVRCTPGHPWWVEGQQRWVLAGDLRVGDQLRLEDGRRGVALGVASKREVARTFNFEVEELHSYFVAASQDRASALVHNASLRKFGGFISGDRGELRRRVAAARRGDAATIAELRAAKALRAQGRNVHFSTPQGNMPGHGGIQTAEFRVGGTRGTGFGGVRHEVYSPTTQNVGRIAGTFAHKLGQADQFILDLTRNKLTPADVGNIVRRINGVPGIPRPAQEVLLLQGTQIIGAVR